MKSILLLSLIITGCNQFPPIAYQNPELMPVVNIVLTEGVKRNKFYSIKDITIDFADLEESAVGVCETGVDNNKIFIDKKYWIDMPQDREQIMAHELGHCLLNLEHNDLYKNNYPVSLMDSVIFSSSIFIQHRDYYYDELFGH